MMLHHLTSFPVPCRLVHGERDGGEGVLQEEDRQAHLGRRRDEQRRRARPRHPGRPQVPGLLGSLQGRKEFRNIFTV